MPRILSQADIAGFRDRLCSVAAELFVERGPEGFTMRELACRAGVSAMTPYRYFSGKNDILAVVRAKAFGRFADHLETTSTLGTPQERLGMLGQAYVKFALEEKISYRLMFELSQPGAENVPELVAQERRAQAAMTAYAGLGPDAGRRDSVLMGQVLWASLHGVIVLHLAGKLNREEFDRLLAETMRVVAGYYRAPPIPRPIRLAPTERLPVRKRLNGELSAHEPM